MAESQYVYVTQERRIELEKELHRMKTVGREEIAGKIAEARAHGDLSENAEYDAAKEEQGKFESRIHRLENVLARSLVIDPSTMSKETVHILAIVRIFNHKSKTEMTYQMVSPEEADFANGKIGVSSPVGQALMGKKKGERVKVTVPAGLLEIDVLDIS